MTTDTRQLVADLSDAITDHLAGFLAEHAPNLPAPEDLPADADGLWQAIDQAIDDPAVALAAWCGGFVPALTVRVDAVLGSHDIQTSDRP